MYSERIYNIRKANILWCLDSNDTEGKPIDKNIYGPGDWTVNKKFDISL